MSRNYKFIIDVIVLIVVYIFLYQKYYKKMDKKQCILYTLFYVYISLVIYFTLMPIVTSLPYILDHEYVSMYLKPFDDYIHSKGDATFQLVINVIMFIPFGFLYPLLKKKSFLNVMMTAFLFTLSIELLQPLLNTFRISDITDVITNTTGALVGYLLYKLFKKLFKNI